ncbi:MAG: PQQ-dependent sugar dehydrogenase [Anaerolineae bacterium]|nr:MAG: PQQ-dependent sugar dehydrogenase [Anaerolineae bacterium]
MNYLITPSTYIAFFRNANQCLHRLIVPVIFLVIGATACQDDQGITVITTGDAPLTSSVVTETPAISEPTQVQSYQETEEIGENGSSTSPTQTTGVASAIPTLTALMPDTTPRPTDTRTPTPSLVQSISLVPVIGGFIKPTDLVHANDERLFVVEQGGKIWIVEDNQRIEESFLDITDRVGSSQLEQGLLSLAFHPNYPEINSIFVNYTNLQGATVISRFLVDPTRPNKALAESEEILLTIDQPFGNHNGGQLKFGPDQMLYIGLGDGGGADDPFNNGQNPSTLLGTLLRIDVNMTDGYAIPPDNPYLEDASIPDEIWATGLRNPWRFSFDRETGGLYLSDVGQSSWEEINYQEADSGGGANYGWNITEGNHCFASESCDMSGFITPVAEYSHAEGGCSVTGGYVYRGKLYPEMSGNYFFGDYCSGFIWSLIQETGGEWKKNLVLQGGFNLSSFGEDVNGELYVLDHSSGTIYRLQP